MNIDDEWTNFISTGYNDATSDLFECTHETIEKDPPYLNITGSVPEPTDIYISTKSKIAYLTEPIDLKIFWMLSEIDLKNQNRTCVEICTRMDIERVHVLEYSNLMAT